MTSALSQWPKGQVMAMAKRLGAVAAGCAAAEPVDAEAREFYEQWIARGCHGSMAYLEKYRDTRYDPRKLLAGARTVVSLAFPYRPAGGYHHPCIADYALGLDYHIVLKQRLAQLADFIRDEYGAASRICVDTAPILERYWAERSGVGFIGLNRQLIVPGAGSGVFLAEVVTTLALEPDSPLAMDCGGCARCLESCPGHALCSDALDARRCLSYLTIECRDHAIPPVTGAVYGCDMCQRCCPHNSAEPPEPLDEFRPDPRLLKLDRAALAALSSGDWRRLTKGSAMRRIPLRQLRRNLGL